MIGFFLVTSIVGSLLSFFLSSASFSWSCIDCLLSSSSHRWIEIIHSMIHP